MPSILISISSNILFLSLTASTAAWTYNLGTVIKPWLFRGDNQDFDKIKLQFFLILFTEKTKKATVPYACPDASQKMFSSTSILSICWKPYQRFRLIRDILARPLFYLIQIVSISSGILLPQSNFNFPSSWMITLVLANWVLVCLRGRKLRKLMAHSLI